jgi:hypothetical protein
MEIINPHGTFDSCEVSSKSLEDKGAAKEPLPFLRSFINIRHNEERAFMVTYLFVIVFALLDTKSEDP